MPKIDAVYAFISTDEGIDDEGVVAWKFGAAWMPLLGADKARVESLKPIAKRIAQITKKRIVLAKFTVREDLEIITGE